MRLANCNKFFAIPGFFLVISLANASQDYDDYVNYCTNAGGVVEKMPVEVITAKGLTTGFSKSFCTFYPTNGFIAIGLKTFASNTPNIAATYIKQLPKINSKSPLINGKFSNPGQNLCQNLGGAEITFIMQGGFTNKLGKADICVFGDGSMVSAWTLIYMANNEEGYKSVKDQVNSEPLTIKIPNA